MRTLLALGFLPPLLLPGIPQIEPGEKFPELAWETIYEEDPESLSQVKGKLVLLLFMALGGEQDKEALKTLNRMHEENKDRGLFLLALTKSSTVRIEKFEEDWKIEFPIARGREAFKKLGIKVTPVYYLLGPDGRVLARNWGEYPTKSLIEVHLARVVIPLDLPGEPPYAKILDAWRRRRFGEVKASLAEAADRERGKPEVEKNLRKALEILDNQVRNVGAEVRHIQDGPDFHAAMLRFQEIKVQYKGLGPDRKAEEILKRYKSDRTIKKEIAAIKELRRLQKTYDPAKNPRNRRRLVDKLRKFMSKYAGMRASRLAGDALEKLQ